MLSLRWRMLISVVSVQANFGAAQRGSVIRREPVTSKESAATNGQVGNSDIGDHLQAHFRAAESGGAIRMEPATSVPKARPPAFGHSGNSISDSMIEAQIAPTQLPSTQHIDGEVTGNGEFIYKKKADLAPFRGALHLQKHRKLRHGRSIVTDLPDISMVRVDGMGRVDIMQDAERQPAFVEQAPPVVPAAAPGPAAAPVVPTVAPVVATVAPVATAAPVGAATAAPTAPAAPVATVAPAAVVPAAAAPTADAETAPTADAETSMGNFFTCILLVALGAILLLVILFGAHWYMRTVHGGSGIDGDPVTYRRRHSSARHSSALVSRQASRSSVTRGARRESRRADRNADSGTDTGIENELLGSKSASMTRSGPFAGKAKRRQLPEEKKAFGTDREGKPGPQSVHEGYLWKLSEGIEVKHFSMQMWTSWRRRAMKVIKCDGNLNLHYASEKNESLDFLAQLLDPKADQQATLEEMDAVTMEVLSDQKTTEIVSQPLHQYHLAIGDIIYSSASEYAEEVPDILHPFHISWTDSSGECFDVVVAAKSTKERTEWLDAVSKGCNDLRAKQSQLEVLCDSGAFSAGLPKSLPAAGSSPSADRETQKKRGTEV